MNRVNKYHYTLHQDGLRLKKHCEINKEIANTKARQRANIPSKQSRYDIAYPFFNKSTGNDGALEFIFTNKKGRNILLYANTSVDDRLNPFYIVGNGSYGKYGNFVLKPTSPQFEVFNTTRKRDINDGSPRNHDTEFKLLEFLGSIIKPSDEGIVNLYTKYQPCLSCDYVMVQFVKKYKNVKLNVYFAEEYSPQKKGGL